MKNSLTREECKNRQLMIIVELDKICKKYNLSYTLGYGSLIGSVRHKGFIPWDDDIDIAMFRDDYEQLLNIIKDNKKDVKWLDIIDYEVDNNYYYPFAKAVDKRTIAKMDNNITKHGIWVDIFPIDGLPNNFFLRKYHLMINYIYRQMIIAMTTDFNNNKGIEKKWIKKILNFIGNLIGKQKIVKNYQFKVKKYKVSDSKYVGCLSTPYVLKEEFEKNKLVSKIDMDFENYIFKGLENYNYYLTKLYGDYMKIPNQSNQKNHSIKAWLSEDDNDGK